MKILYLTPRLPYPPDRGDRVRTFNFLHQLGKEHEILLLSFIAKSEEREYLTKLSPLCRRIEVVLLPFYRSVLSCASRLFSGLPLQASYYMSGEFRRILGKVLEEEKPDLIITQMFRLFPYVEGKGFYTVVDLTDMISLEISRALKHRSLPWKMIYRVELPRIARYETHIGRKADECWLISEHDAEVLTRSNPSARVEVVAHNFRDRCPTGPGTPYVPGRILFTGNFNVAHNVAAARILMYEVFPLVKKQAPEARLALVGKDGELMASGPVPQGVEIKGFVEDIDKEYQQSAVFAAPLLYCTGLQTKVVESMVNGTPVVTSGLCNNGIQARDGDQILVADSSADMAARIVQCLADARFRDRIGAEGMKYAQSRFCSDQALQRVNQIRDILASPE